MVCSYTRVLRGERRENGTVIEAFQSFRLLFITYASVLRLR